MIKFSCEKVFLQNAIAVTSRAVAQKSSIPALESLLLHADQQLTISGYNMQTGIRTNVFANVVEGGDIVLNARLFGDIIRRMPDDMITFTADEKMMVHVSCGDADFDILGLSAADYPDLPEVEDEYAVSMQQKVLRSMIEEVAFAVSTNESRPVHTGALFEIADMCLNMVAVDGFRLAFRREKLEKLEGGAFSFVCPGSALNEVKSICGDTEDLVTITLGKRHILFEIGDTQLICRRLEGEFLDYKNAIPRKNPIQITVETKALIESIDRVSVVISDKLKSPVRCLFDHDKVMLSAKTGNGEAKDVCRVIGDGNKLEIGFNNRYLMEALRYAPAEKVKIELNTGVSVALVYGEGGTLDAAATEDAIVRAVVKSVKPADAALTVEYYASATSGSLGSAGKDWMPIAGGKSGLLTYPTISEGEQQIRLTYAGNKNYAKTEIVVTVDVKGHGLRDP